jgi:hypothetical protein
MEINRAAIVLAAALAVLLPSQFAAAEETAEATDSADLAKKLSNPVADLISVPMKLDWNTGIGPANADQDIYVVQPVIPITLNEEWNVISRTILPYIHQESPVAGGSSIGGLGDTLQSLFFSPKSPSASGWIWGVGPALSIPTATKDELGSGKWSLGPTVVLLKQEHGWTYGVLANQIWSIAGESDRAGVSSMFVQPFLTYTTHTYTTIGINTESTYDWKASQWTVPINLTVSQLVRIGGHPVSFLLGVREYVESPSGGPDWGLRFQVTLLFPKK